MPCTTSDPIRSGMTPVSTEGTTQGGRSSCLLYLDCTGCMKMRNCQQKRNPVGMMYRERPLQTKSLPGTGNIGVLP